MNKSNLLFSLLVILILPSCKSSQGTATTIDPVNQKQFLTLAEYLQTTPGLQISYQSEEPVITIRGLQSLGGEQEPLYIIDGAQVGNSYRSAADIVDPNDIKNIMVLKDLASTSSYGLRGSNGVIVIKTGKKNK